jgi:hypothetical protein
MYRQSRAKPAACARDDDAARGWRGGCFFEHSAS